MSVPADYKCNKCNEVFTITKQTAIENFPTIVVCTCCSSEETQRLWSVPIFDVALGIHGNASTGYDQEFVYKPSKIGKFKGQKV